jgi:DNA polymerase III epsilon subunit-like protein
MDDTFISVDCETSGPFPGRHALLSVGAVLVARVGGRWGVASRYYDEWAPPLNAEENPAATRVHGLDLVGLRARGTPLPQAARAFADWVAAAGEGRRVFVGYNAAFDWAFVLHALGEAGVDNPFHHAPLDLKSAIWGLHGGAWKSGSNVEALVRAVGRPLPARDELRPHHAGDDALMQADMLVALLDRLGSATTVP